MSSSRKPTVLDDKWITNADEVPAPRSLIAPQSDAPVPFPLSLDAQKRLLELIYNRKSGIITRQELIDVIYNTTEDSRPGQIIRSRA